MAAELCYKDNIAELESLLHTNIPSEIETYFYNGLLTGIFSIFELFLSDVLLCLIFNNNVAYERALDYLREKKIKIDQVDIDLTIQQYFTERIVYHKFDTVSQVFKKVLQIKFPDTKKIKSFLPKRNNITHRFAFSNIDRMRMTTINTETLHNLITHCNEFVDNLINEINKIY